MASYNTIIACLIIHCRVYPPNLDAISVQEAVLQWCHVMCVDTIWAREAGCCYCMYVVLYRDHCKEVAL